LLTNLFLERKALPKELKTIGGIKEDG